MLPAGDTDARRPARNLNYLHTEGCPDAARFPWRRLTFGNRHFLCRATETGRNCAGICYRRRFYRRQRRLSHFGDNIFYGKLDFFREALAIEQGACIFGYQVRDPERYGVVEFGEDGRAISLEEKPERPKSQFAVPGLYVYDDQVVDICKTLRPSARGELEITDLNRVYLDRNQLFVRLLGRGMAWLDTGTQTSLLEAGNYIATIEHRQGLKVACLEEVALRMGFIDQRQLNKIIDRLPKAEYRDYLRLVCDEGAGASFLEPTNDAAG